MTLIIQKPTGSKLTLRSVAMSWIITGTQKNKGLLDEFSGAAAAYSLRDLSLLRNVPVVRVRRDNDNAEQDFTATEVSDGTLAAWVGAGNNGFVRTWYDQSGNGINASQTTTSAQPKIVSTGSLVAEGIDFFRNELSASIGIISQPLTTFAVFRPRQALKNDHIIDTLNLANRIVVGPRLTGGYRIFAGTNVDFGAVDTSRKLWTALFNGAQSFLYLNSTPVLSNVNPGLNSIEGLRIGADATGNKDNFVDGFLSELIIYPNSQSTNRAAIESNINAHYSIF